MEDEIDASKLELIGAGGFSTVYRFKTLNNSFAVKYVWCENEKQIEKYRRECEELERKRHPNIVNFIRTHQRSQQELGIVTEYCERGTLRNVMLDKKLIYSINAIAWWAEGLFDALAFLSNGNTIHADIKPENIFVTKEFAVKLGDFGTARMLEVTREKTEMVLTQRYASPPVRRKEDSFEEIFLMSSRNDVYSLGLVIWELVERKVVLSQFGPLGSFSHLHFWAMVSSKKLESIDPPLCPEKLQEIVSRCINFDYQKRKKAEDVRDEFKELISCYPTFDRPLEEPEQEELIRPIGFDETNLRIPVYEKEYSMNNMSVSFGESVSKAAEQETDPKPKVLPQGFLGSTKILNTRDKFQIHEPFHYVDDELRSSFGQKFTAMDTSKTRTEMISMSEEVVNRKMQERVDFHIVEIERYKPTPEYDSTKVHLEKILENHLTTQLMWYADIFGRLVVFQKEWKRRFSYDDYYRQICIHIQQLDRMRENIFTRRIYFQSYFTPQTRKQWLSLPGLSGCLRPVPKNTHCFISKDLTEARGFEGTWVKMGHNEKFVRIKKNTAGAVIGLEEMIPIDWEPIDYYMVIEGLLKVKKSIEETILNQIRSWVPLENLQQGHEKLLKTIGQDFPIPGYIFQLRNPPRPPKCKCQPECPVHIGAHFSVMWLEAFKQVDHLERFLKSEKELGLHHYQCTDQSLKDYIELFNYFCQLLGDDRLNEFPPLPKRRKMKLELNLPESDKQKLDYFYFLQYPRRRTRFGKPKDFVVLLDHPSNYQPFERIPCFDYQFNFFTIDPMDCLREFEELDLNPEKNLIRIKQDWLEYPQLHLFYRPHATGNIPVDF